MRYEVRTSKSAQFLIFGQCNLCNGAGETRPTHRRTYANLYPPERQLTKASEPLFDLEGRAKGQI